MSPPLFQPLPPPCASCGTTTLIAPAFEAGQRIFAIRCPACGRSATLAKPITAAHDDFTGHVPAGRRQRPAVDVGGVGAAAADLDGYFPRPPSFWLWLRPGFSPHLAASLLAFFAWR
jgi:hypothetical protein